jgi:HEPN domain-containing protein
MDKTTEYEEWIKYADDDLATAELLLVQFRKPLNIICFHCQQAAEKYLKALLVSQNIPFEKTHDLPHINNLCIKSDANFSNIMGSCLMLNPYSVITRYPSELELIEQDAVSAISAVKTIQKAVLKKIHTS